MINIFIPKYAEQLILENPTFLLIGARRDVVFVIEVYTFVIVGIVSLVNIVTCVFTVLYFRKCKFKHVAGVLNILAISPLNIAAGILILKCNE